MPESPYHLMDLGIDRIAAGAREDGVVTMSRALNMAPSDKTLKAIYSTSMPIVAFTAFRPEVRQAMMECFKTPHEADLTRFGYAWTSLIVRDPRLSSLLPSAANESFDKFRVWADALDERSAALLRDPFFLQGLRLLNIANYPFERFFTHLRRYICLSYEPLTANGRIGLFADVLCPLAEHCFFTEYVLAQDESELSALESLKGKTDATSLSLIACYRSLYDAMPDKGDLLHALAAQDDAFASLVKTQFDAPAEEARLKESLPSFGHVSDGVSLAVQNQYEENPYPRWNSICTTPLPHDELFTDGVDRNLPLKILIAGCGTGRQAIAAAVRYPNARITAIDLSRSSLAYAQRMAEECGLSRRIEFIHADILAMKDWPGTFDIVECSGVLHHMDDPFLGWQTLNEKLKPGGYFKVGLYSESARRPVIYARDFIARAGFTATPESIRACRQAIFALPADHPARFVTKNGDFFVMSLARDLMFHVQEHRMNLPVIRNMMNRLGLVPVRFITSHAHILSQYDALYPEDAANRANLDNWHDFEGKFPNTFSNMYQFWAQKIV